MRPFLFGSLTLCAYLALGPVRAPAQEKPLPVAAAIQTALDRHPLRGARVGIAVRRISDGKEVFTSRATELFELASNTKLFTTAAALWRLGAEHEFRTTLIANGKIEDGVLKGDLVLVGGGDPSLCSRVQGSAMLVPRQMVLGLQEAGIREIAGDFVLDDRLFDRVHRAPSWPEDESLWWYAAPVSALSFNDNCVEVKVAGGPAPGDPVTISVTPSFPYLRLVNRCVTSAKDREGEVTFSRDAEGAIAIAGRMPPGAARSENIAVDDPPLFFAAAIQAEMAKLGIRVLGQTRLARADEKWPADAREVFVWKSKLVDAISMANRRSQNFCAEQILKTLGAARFRKGSFEGGVAAVREFTRAAHLPDDAVTLRDGCGLSTGNRATPQAVAGMLEVIYRSRLEEVFYNSLAVNGEAETTLKNRLTDPAIRGRIHAKTGTIKSNGITALSGYAEATDDEIYVFSILVNGLRPGGVPAARAMEDSICYALVGVPEKAKNGRR